MRFTFGNRETIGTREGRRRIEKRALANAGFTFDEHGPARAIARAGDERAQPIDLGVATYQRRKIHMVMVAVSTSRPPGWLRTPPARERSENGVTAPRS